MGLISLQFLTLQLNSVRIPKPQQATTELKEGCTRLFPKGYVINSTGSLFWRNYELGAFLSCCVTLWPASLPRDSVNKNEVYWVTHRIEDAEEFCARVNKPCLRVSLNNKSYNQKLNKAKEAGIRRNREASRVLLQNWGLQDEPSGPRQAMANEIDAAKSPVFALCIS